jgi:hypothetical protein
MLSEVFDPTIEAHNGRDGEPRISSARLPQQVYRFAQLA